MHKQKITHNVHDMSFKALDVTMHVYMNFKIIFFCISSINSKGNTPVTYTATYFFQLRVK